MAPLAAFGFHTNGRGPRCAQLVHPLHEFPTFDPVTVGQKCPHSNRRLVRRLEEHVHHRPPWALLELAVQ